MARGDLVALTGGTGFVGSHVADALLVAGYRVRALARRPENPGWLKDSSAEIVPGDVRKPESLEALVAGARAVVHVAGRTSARNEAEYMAANAAGPANVVAAVRKSAPGAHVVLVSSQAVGGPSADGAPVRACEVPRPLSSYGRSKLAGEEAVRKEPGLAFTILRPSAVYGPRETAIRGLFVAASRGFVPILAGGTPRVQLVHVRDVVASILGALSRGGRGETFFVAHPEVLTYRGIAETLATLPARRPWLIPVPASVIRTAGSVAGALSALSAGPPVFNAEKANEMLQAAWLCDVSDTQLALGQPFRTGFAEGAKLTWDWYLERRWIRAGDVKITTTRGAS
jgi:nucleoside-diphosphate-sugar epimerase